MKLVEPLDIHIVSAPGSEEDDRLRVELENHLLLLAREGILRVASTAERDPGAGAAHVIVLLGSPDFAASRGHVEEDTRRALAREARGEARVILVVLRAFERAGTPLADLPALPLDGEPVAGRADREAAWQEIARGLLAIHERGYLGVRAGRGPAPRPVQGGPPRQIPTNRLFPGSAPEPAFVVPRPRNPRFVGHEQTLAELHVRLSTLEQYGRCQVSLMGPDGIGRTELALEYAHRHRDDYPGGVYWIDAAQGFVAGLDALLVQVAPERARRAPMGRDFTAMRFMSSLGERADVLMVLDHVDPRATRNHFLFGSSRPDMRILSIPERAPDEPSGLTVPVLEEEAAVALLFATRGGDPEALDDARALVATLACFPLAIVLAGVHLRERGATTLAEYRARLGLPGGRQTPRGAAAAAIRVQCEAVSGAAARPVLQTAALIGRGADVPRARLALLTGLPVDSAIAELATLGLVEDGGERGIRLHPCVREMVVAQIPDRAEFVEARVAQLASVLGDMDRLRDEMVARDVDAVLADLDAGLALATEGAAPLLSRLRDTLQAAAPVLRAWKPEAEPEGLLQQLVNSARELGIAEIGALAEAKLLALRQPFLRWTGHAPGISRRTLRAPGALSAFALTALGEAAVTASPEGALHVWALPHGELRRTIQGHAARINDVAVTAAQRLVVSASDDGTARVHRLDTGELLLVFRGHAAAVSSIAVTPDARLAVSGARDGTVLTWDLATGEVLRALEGIRDLRDVAVTPDGRFVITAAGMFAHIHDLATGQLAWRLAHQGLVRRVEMAAHGTAILALAKGCAPRLWDVATGLSAGEIKAEQPASATALALTPSARSAVAALTTGAVEVWDLRRRRCVRAFEGHPGATLGLAVTPYGLTAVSAAEDGTIKIWETGARETDYGYEQLHQMSVPDQRQTMVVGLAITADGHLAVSAVACESALKLWDVARGSLAAELDGGDGPLSFVTMTPDGRLAAAAGQSGSLTIWDLAARRIVRRLEGASGPVNDAAFSPDGRFVVWSGRDGTLRAWDLAGSAEARTLAAAPRTPAEVVVTTDGRAVSLDAEAMKIWDLARGEILHTVDGCRGSCAGLHVRDDDRLAVFGAPGALAEIDVATGALVRGAPANHATPSRCPIAVSSGGAFAALITSDRFGRGARATIELWDLRAAVRIAGIAFPDRFPGLPLGAPSAHPARCAISADGRTLVAGDHQGKIHFGTFTKP